MRRLRFSIKTLLLLVPPVAIFAACKSFSVDYQDRFEWNRIVMPYTKPEIPKEFESEVEYLSKGDEGTITLDGPSTYREEHASGWIWCLRSFYEEDSQWRQIDRFYDFRIPPPQFEASKDGYTLCLQQLESKLESETEAELRNSIAFKGQKDTSLGVVVIAASTMVWIASAGFVFLKRPN